MLIKFNPKVEHLKCVVLTPKEGLNLTRTMVHLLPGTNEVTDDEWKAMRGNINVELENGEIVALVKENSSELNINIYPNPAEDKINIELKNETKGNVVITNQLGQVVKEMNIDGKELTIDVEDLTSGVYFINVSNQRMKFLKN